jgi:subtilase family serine protease
MAMGQSGRRRRGGYGRSAKAIARAATAAVVALVIAVIVVMVVRRAPYSPSRLLVPPNGGVERGIGVFRRVRPPSSQECLRLNHRPCLTPTQVRAAYGIDTMLQRGITGRGRTITIIVSFGSPTLRADLHAFDRAFGLPDPQLQILSPLGERHPYNSVWAGETTLDVEWAHAIAPGARLVVLESPVDETEGVQGLPEFLALDRYALLHHLADVISQSWDATEDTLLDGPGRAIVAQLHAFYVDAARQGVTVVAASGDEGMAGLDRSLSHLYPYPVVQYPASDPYVLAVGGTHLVIDARGYARDETAWAGSGGGSSKLFPEPIYQRGLPLATQRQLGYHRGLPDVSYNAGIPILMYWEGGWSFPIGTSAAAPQWAGLIALADDAAGSDLGLVNPALYQMAASPHYRTALHDITHGGTNGPTLGRPGGSAGLGWDIATGLGSPRAGLVPGLVATSRAARGIRVKADRELGSTMTMPP